MIPCEFCGIQLEEEILFHHQVLNSTGSVESHPTVQGWALVAHFRNSGSCPCLRLSHSGVHVKGCATLRLLLKSSGLI